MGLGSDKGCRSDKLLADSPPTAPEISAFCCQDLPDIPP